MTADTRPIAHDLPTGAATLRPVSAPLVLTASDQPRIPDRGLVRVTARQSEDGTTLTVEDPGPGIPDGELDRVFERFHRTEGAGRVGEAGAGLGLAISKWIVDLHGGTITAANMQPDGCTMTVHHPRPMESAAIQRGRDA